MMRSCSSSSYSILLRSCAAGRRQTTTPATSITMRRFLVSSSSTSSSTTSSRTSTPSTSPSASPSAPSSTTILPKMMEDKEEEEEKEKNNNSTSTSSSTSSSSSEAASEAASETETETATGKEEAEKKIGLMDHFKQLGMPFLAWWTGVWVVTGIGIYSTMEIFGIDVLGMLQTTLPSNEYIDFSKVDPKTGNVMTALAVNELIEPIRFPFVLLTVKPVIKWWKNIKE